MSTTPAAPSTVSVQAVPVSAGTALKWLFVLQILLIGIIAFVGIEWHASQVELKNMKATIATTEKQRVSEVQATQTKIKEVQNVQRSAKTPNEQLAAISKLASLPQPLALPSNANGQGNGKDGDSTTGLGAGAVIPAPDVQPLLNFTAGCAICSLKLANDEQQIKQLTTERDLAVKTAKGGSFWQRTRKAAKYVAIGVGVGIVVGMAATKK
jgi:hypothetical protein